MYLGHKRTSLFLEESVAAFIGTNRNDRTSNKPRILFIFFPSTCNRLFCSDYHIIFKTAGKGPIASQSHSPSASCFQAWCGQFSSNFNSRPFIIDSTPSLFLSLSVFHSLDEETPFTESFNSFGPRKEAFGEKSLDQHTFPENLLLELKSDLLFTLLTKRNKSSWKVIGKRSD